MARFEILSFRCWAVIIGTMFIRLMLPVQTDNPYKWAEQTKWTPDDDSTTREWVNEFALVAPFQLWPNVTGKYFLELEDMTDFDCPRVYYPTCATNKVTYVNPCIMHALKQTFMRFGPCVVFRRSVNEKVVSVPKIWRTNKTELEKIKKNYVFTTKDFLKMLNESSIDAESFMVHESKRLTNYSISPKDFLKMFNDSSIDASTIMVDKSIRLRNYSESPKDFLKMLNNSSIDDSSFMADESIELGNYSESAKDFNSLIDALW